MLPRGWEKRAGLEAREKVNDLETKRANYLQRCWKSSIRPELHFVNNSAFHIVLFLFRRPRYFFSFLFFASSSGQQMGGLTPAAKQLFKNIVWLSHFHYKAGLISRSWAEREKCYIIVCLLYCQIYRLAWCRGWKDHQDDREEKKLDRASKVLQKS